MLKELIKIANSLDAAGLQKEADELDEVIQKLSQKRHWEDMALEGTISSIKSALHKQVDEKVAELKQIAHSRPESYRGSKESWMWTHLDNQPLVIQYPSK